MSALTWFWLVISLAELFVVVMAVLVYVCVILPAPTDTVNKEN